MTPGAVSSLFVIWSVASFVLEVPSGAWADLTDRRTLLILSGPIYAAGFGLWIVCPTYAGFAAGFVLWALSGALMSGTFEALLYDELAARGAAGDYPGLLGMANSAATAASVAAIAAAAPLLAWGGYAAVGWTSVAVAIVHGALAWALPAAPKSESADATKDAIDRVACPFAARYLATLRAGVTEATSHQRVRRLVVIVAVLYGLTAYDEYFPSVAREAGATSVRRAVARHAHRRRPVRRQRARRTDGPDVAAGDDDGHRRVGRVDRSRSRRPPPRRVSSPSPSATGSTRTSPS